MVLLRVRFHGMIYISNHVEMLWLVPRQSEFEVERGRKLEVINLLNFSGDGLSVRQD
jgi:hypothetical protein